MEFCLPYMEVLSKYRWNLLLSVYSPHEFKRDTQVIPEVEILSHMNDVVLIIFIFPAQSIQDFHFNQCLMMEPKYK